MAENPCWVPTAPKEEVVAQPVEEETKAFSIVVGENENFVLSADPDCLLKFIEKEKKLSIVKAWLVYEKSKIVNKDLKKRSILAAWYNKKAVLEANREKYEEQKAKKKEAKVYEKIENKRALVQKQSEEKKAMIQAKYLKELVKIQTKAADYRERETTPKKFLGCFWV